MSVRLRRLLAAVCLLGPMAAAAQPGTATLSGTVVNAETGTPLAGAHVFIASSMVGTATDADGRFLLSRVPAGAHRLYASMLGFAPDARDTLLRADSVYAFAIALRPEILEVGEVIVTAREERRWHRHLRKFERVFLGESGNADSTRLLNPHVLSFDSTWGRLRASASEPLLIENRALGYRVQYFLEEFEYTGSTVRYDGEPLFESILPASGAEAEAWERARARTYLGSLHHYLLALLADSTAHEHFTTYHRFDLDNPYSKRGRRRIDPNSVLHTGPSPTEKELGFNGYLEVVYTAELEEEAFLRWQGFYPTRAPAYQRSWIKLTDGPTLIDHTGEIVDPYGITVFGYFAFERLADMLPKEYRPGRADHWRLSGGD